MYPTFSFKPYAAYDGPRIDPRPGLWYLASE